MKSSRTCRYKKSGFTLAEVLITLGIIGIIAAMTIPTLISNSQKAQYVAALKRTYSMLSQVQGLLASDNGDFVSAMSNINSSEGFASIFAKKMNVAKICNTASGIIGCLANKYMYLNGDILTFANYHSSFVTVDGIAYWFERYSSECSSSKSSGITPPILDKQICGIIYVDINGPNRGPSKLGRDLFSFWVTNRGVYPFGTGDPKQDIDTECKIIDGGTTCTVKVLSEDAMNY